MFHIYLVNATAVHGGGKRCMGVRSGAVLEGENDNTAESVATHFFRWSWGFLF